MITYVLGAPGVGKSTVAAQLRAGLADWTVLDWDAFMGPAGALAGADISRAPHTWEAYGELVRVVVEQIRPGNVVLFGVCTPEELADWPQGRWLLLDCSDEERRKRLAIRNDPAELDEALQDAASYRLLGLPVLDSTGRTPAEVARAIAAMIDPPPAPRQ